MLAVVKTPHTEISINGDGAAKIFEYLKQKYPVEILSSDDDDEKMVPVKASEYWKTNVTPGSLLKGFRLKHGLTQSDLSKITGISQVMISDYETGKRKLTMKAATKFAAALNETPEKFFP